MAQKAYNNSIPNKSKTVLLNRKKISPIFIISVPERKNLIFYSIVQRNIIIYYILKAISVCELCKISSNHRPYDKQSHILFKISFCFISLYISI